MTKKALIIDKVERVVTRSATPITSRAVAEQVGITPGAAKEMLRRLQRAKRIGFAGTVRAHGSRRPHNMYQRV